MPSQLDPRVEAIRDKYGLHKDDFWKLPQGRDVWLVKHAALEVVAAKAGITFDLPQIIEASGGEGVAAICVRGFYGDRSIWSIGEASPKNCKNAYPWAIAEKRAIDRVVLKLVGLHGLVYSEEESDDFKPQAATPNTVTGTVRPGDGRSTYVKEHRAGEEARDAANSKPVDAFPLRKGWEWQNGDPPAKSSAQLKKEGGFAEFSDNLNDCANMSDLKWVENKWSALARQQGWPISWKHAACDRIEGREAAILQSMSPEHLADVPLADALKQSLKQNVLNAG